MNAVSFAMHRFYGHVCEDGGCPLLYSTSTRELRFEAERMTNDQKILYATPALAPYGFSVPLIQLGQN